MILTSSVRFIRQAPHFVKNNETLNIKKINLSKEHIDNSLSIEWYDIFVKNKYIMEKLKINNVGLEYGEKRQYRQNEGRIYTKEHFNEIYCFITKNKLFENISHETYFEETLLPSLAIHFKGKPSKNYCYTYWELSGKKCARRPKGEIIYYQTPSIEMVLDKMKNEPNMFLIKRIPDDLSDPLYDFINSLPQ